jgi:hypothetical protein
MDVSSSRRCSMTIIVPSYDAGTVSTLLSPAAGSVWCNSEQGCVAAPMAAQQQLVLSSPVQTPAAAGFASCQVYQQQQQQHVMPAQRAATSPLPLLVPVCAIPANSQPLQMQQQQQQLAQQQQRQQQQVIMASPMPSSEYMFFEDCVPSCNAQHMTAMTINGDSTTAAMSRPQRNSFSLEQQQLPIAAANRQRPASFTAGTTYEQQQQQQQVVMMANGQQLAVAAAGNNSLSCPLPMLLPQQQQQQQQQMVLCQDMGFSGQLQTAVCGAAAFGNAAIHGSSLSEMPAMSMPSTLQQQQQLMFMGLDATRVPGSPLQAMLPGSSPQQLQQQQQQQQQQQMCMSLGSAMVRCDGHVPTGTSSFAQVWRELLLDDGAGASAACVCNLHVGSWQSETEFHQVNGRLSSVVAQCLCCIMCSWCRAHLGFVDV